MSLTMITDHESKLTALMVMFPEKVADKYFAAIRPEMLNQEINRRIYDACLRLREQRKPIDVVNLADPELVARVVDGYQAFGNQSSINISPIINQVHEAYKYRMLRELAASIDTMSTSREEMGDIWSTIDATRSALDIRVNEQMFTLAELADLYGNAETYEEMSRSCVSSGFAHFDKTVIFKPGDLIILAGRPSMGKTDFALLYGKSVAEHDQGVGIISLEMRGMYLLKRLATSAGHFYGGSDVEKYIRGAEAVCGLPMVIDESPKHNISSLRSRAKKMIDQYGIKILIIDYLTLLDPPKAENRNQEVTKTTRELKHMANDLQIPILVLSQLNRAIEHRPNKRPVLADLRESGAIEQDADSVMFCFRPGYYNLTIENMRDVYGVKDLKSDDEVRTYLEIITGKQREGATGIVPFYYDKKNKILAQPDNLRVPEYEAEPEERLPNIVPF